LRRLGHVLGNGSVTQAEMARDLAHGQVKGMYLVDLLWRQHCPEAVDAAQESARWMDALGKMKPPPARKSQVVEK